MDEPEHEKEADKTETEASSSKEEKTGETSEQPEILVEVWSDSPMWYYDMKHETIMWPSNLNKVSGVMWYNED